ncbi:MAG TPA: glycosyltransferase family 39 protein [Devosiaceae bacterium]|nr:glycosyltransferase family 39 protein [Devosiaceae bacterium]
MSPVPALEPRERRALLWLLLVSTAARLALAGLLDLGQDESYALAISRPFQWSFFDHPPMAFWLAGLMQALFGRELSPFLLRLPFVLMFTASSYVLFLLTRRFYGARAGIWATGLATAAPFFFLSAGGWVVPDGPLILFLLLAALFLARALEVEKGGGWRDWLLCGLCFGLALLSKYQAGLAGLGALVVLAMPQHRLWLRRPQPYVAGLLAAALFLPVIAWNAQNGWVSFTFQLSRGGGGSPFDALRPFGLLIGELAYLLPWTLVALLVAGIWAMRTPAGRFFVALAAPPILLFNILPLFGSSGLPHWSMSGWLFLFPPLGALLAAGRGWPRILGWLSGAAVTALALTAVLFVSNFRQFPGDNGINHALVEATSWTGVRDGLPGTGVLTRPHTFLAAMSWLDAAHDAEALRPAEPPVVIGDDPRGFAFVSSQEAHLGEDAVFVVAPEAVASAKGLIAAHFDGGVEEVGAFLTFKGDMPAYTHTVLLAHHFVHPVYAGYGLR